MALRQELDIYASIVLIKNIPGYKTRHDNVDLCIIRENTEGEYSGLEHQSVDGVVESLKIITRAKSERIAKFAFSFALANHRKKVTCIHKANIMKLADGLFRNTFRKVAEDYPTLETNDMIVDNASMQAVARPQQFDVMVMPNLYGGILSNVGAALVGGPGIVPGCNMGRDVAVFEPGCRHVGLDIKGKDQANPTAMLLSGSMLLRHLGLDNHANRVSRAVYDVIAEGYGHICLSLIPDLSFTSPPSFSHFPVLPFQQDNPFQQLVIKQGFYGKLTDMCISESIERAIWVEQARRSSSPELSWRRWICDQFFLHSFHLLIPAFSQYPQFPCPPVWM